ncbi:MAG: Fis family transcriptional regulator [Myxococcales bacterium]|nr:Fis family transcriptional regulator [Myxococcales bacterium]
MSLEQLRLRIDRLLEHADDGLYGVDREGRATLVTPSVMAMTGHAMDDMMGRAIHDVLHHSHEDGAHYPRHECPIFTACRTGQVGHARETFWRKDGTSFPVEFATTPIIEQGEVVGGIVVLRDLERRGDLKRELDSTMRTLDAVAVPAAAAMASKVSAPMGSSGVWLATMDMVRRVAPVDTTVLLCGESGTGKELVAQTLHDLSPRRGRPLVKLNCGAIPAGLVESELFGHERGAFTGAAAQRIGRFEQAQDGTLFLDEVGELPLEAQAKLLRVLQEREFERVGGVRTIVSRARIVAATNRDLASLVERGKFRADLFYRLHVFPIHLPPLRDRREDIPLLARHFIEKLQRKLGRRLHAFSPESERRLVAHHWPGNVRELENAIERAAVMSDEGAPLALPPLTGGSSDCAASAARDHAASAVSVAPLDRAAIIASLDEVQWKITGPRGAAAALGIHPNTLRYRMRQLGVRRPAPAA